MTEREEMGLNDLEDQYCIMYAILGRTLLEDFGLDGEHALREGTRLYGQNRGRLHRQRHLDAGLKINMKNLFTTGGDLPGDTRTFRELQRINAQERVSHTLVCPMADIWKEYGCMDIGKIYCEEFHFSCYSTYAYGYTKVNIAKVLTQEGDEYCAFNIILRPQDLPEKLRPVCFEEYDPEYPEPQNICLKPPEAKEGYRSLWLRLYFFLLKAAAEQFGEEGREAVKHGLNRLAKVVSEAFAKDNPIPVDMEFLEEHYPVDMYVEKEEMWKLYGDYGAKELADREFIQPLLNHLHITKGEKMI